MKVLLTHAYFLSEDPKEQEIMRPYPPLGILCLSAYLKKYRIDTAVFDSTFATPDEQRAYIAQHKPAFLCIYVNLMTKVRVLQLIQWVRAQPGLKGTRIVLGGPEVRHHAENFLRHGAHVIVIGEGEETLLEVVETLGSAMNPFLDQVAGIAYLNALGEMVLTAEREKLKDLDKLPLPDREAIPLEKYFTAWRQKHGESALSVSTMRGCPYTCKWCSRAVYGLSYRRRSPEKVVEELAHLVAKYNPDTFWFVDDVFTISHKWLRAFADALAAKGLNIRYECITRADRMNEEVILMLKETGCFRVWIGAESGSQRILDAMDRRVDAGQVREMIQLSRAHGVQAGTFIMLGYPGETETDIEETITHLSESAPDVFTITVAYPIKGTEFFQEVSSSIHDALPWETSSDRDTRFKRTYTDRYYQYAVRRVVNEVHWRIKRQRGPRRQVAAAARHKLRSMAAKAGMMLNRRKP
jgi:radical SAM superfamily enzyme YgiQ (UPF0313 family)